jgi:hypothetical protein
MRISYKVCKVINLIKLIKFIENIKIYCLFLNIQMFFNIFTQILLKYFIKMRQVESDRIDNDNAKD